MKFPSATIEHLRSPSYALLYLGSYAGKQIHKAAFAVSKQLYNLVKHIPGEVEGRYHKSLPEIRRHFIKKLWNYTPAQLLSYEENISFRISQIHTEHKSIIEKTTIDRENHGHLNGIRLSEPESDELIIYFGGITYNWMKSFETLWQLHSHLKVNILSYNYRGTMPACLLDPTEEAVIQDGVDIVLEQIKKGIPANKITLYGRSLGGGVAIGIGQKLASMGIYVDIINERSFWSLQEVISVAVPLIGQAIAQLVKAIEWTLPTYDALISLKGRLIIIYHENDRIVPLPASCKAAIEQFANEHLCVEFVQLQEEKEIPSPYHRLLIPYIHAHCRPFTPSELQKIATAFKNRQR